ncbi:MAG: translation initiation factor IF-2 [Thiotrichales bacterium]|nr:MAG: translation initiation factor IF-2 [Thiotrichales bacterium]
MSNITVKQLAAAIGIDSKVLLEKLKSADISLTKETDIVSASDKRALLSHMRGGGATVVRRKTHTQVSRGNNSVSVERVERRVYSKTSSVATTDTEKKTTSEKEEVVSKVAAEHKDKNTQNVQPSTAKVAAKPKETVSKPQELDNRKRKKPKLQPLHKDKYKHSMHSTNVAVLGEQDRAASNRKARLRHRNKEGVTNAAPKIIKPAVRKVNVPESITVTELAKKMAINAGVLIKHMLKMGLMATINQTLDQDTASLIVEEMGHTPILLKENQLEESILQIDITGEKVKKAPVVTIMGHVDHGKTSLLDYIRRTKTTDTEAGGITQHIGAYHVSTDNGDITFLDTPGHAAFTAMRARGANCTDVVVLVVAADDGVQPQTIEAIQHAKAAKAPIVVAVNKIDKPEADQERIRNELSRHEIISEDWGGQNMFVPISAKFGTGIDTLLETILLQSEVLELTAIKDCPARGVVVEARLDKQKGPISTLLIQNGTLRKGDIILAGKQYGKVRAMLDESGKQIKDAGPALPVEVMGISGTPAAGDEFIVVASEKKAREVALFRQGKLKNIAFAKQRSQRLESMFKDNKKEKTCNVIFKADVHGSAEAIQDALNKLSDEKVKINIISAGTGGITESDVNLALVSKAILFGFNVRADAIAKKLLLQEKMEIRYYSVIYDLINDVKAAMEGLLEPEMQEKIIGIAEVREVFRAPKIGAIAGCMVKEGVVKRNSPVRILRDNVVIYEGSLESLRRFKEDATEVKQGTECGIGIKNYNDIKAKDQIEVYEVISVRHKIA